MTFADLGWLAVCAFLLLAAVAVVPLARRLARMAADIFAEELFKVLERNLRTMSIDELEGVRQYLKQLQIDRLREMTRDLVRQKAVAHAETGRDDDGH